MAFVSSTSAERALERLRIALKIHAVKGGGFTYADDVDDYEYQTVLTAWLDLRVFVGDVKAQQEDEQAVRWHETYNAALTGSLMAYPRLGLREHDHVAAACADTRHGKLGEPNA